VRIAEAQTLQSGSLVSVASCRLTFATSLDEVVPPLELEEASPQTTSQTQSHPPNITHRQSKSSILDPDALGLEPKPSSAQAVRFRGGETVIATELLQLAYDVARESTPRSACELALDRLMKSIECNSGGVLKLDAIASDPAAPASTQPVASQQPTVIAALQRDGKAYHTVADNLIAAVLRDNTAILARNVQAISDPDAAITVHGEFSSTRGTTSASQSYSVSSAILAPMRVGHQVHGLLHLYSRIDEPELTPDNLEVALAVADVLAVTLDNLLRHQSLEVKLKSTRNRLSELERQLGQSMEWVGPSTALKQLREQTQRVGASQATVLIRGESGAGKELVARAIHDFSPRANGPFVALNCAALSATLLESELFGHEKGSFTGATERKIGKFEQAHGGTLMLDELGEMSSEIQAKFLRVLEGKAFERVGGNKPIQADVRVLAATNRDLEQAVKDGHFRSDLYFRLRVIELRVPALRQRPEDILPLAEHFLKLFRSQSGHGPTGFSDRARQAMFKYHWPGNVRELRNCVERAFVLAQGTLAEPEDLALSYLQVPGQAAPESPAATLHDSYQEKTIEALEQEHIEATLAYTGGQKNRAAAILGIERSTLDRKLKRFQS
jgi:Nif-specific regulatory protein